MRYKLTLLMVPGIIGSPDVSLSQANQVITITVHPEPCQTFRGFGTSQNDGDFDSPYASFSRSERTALTRELWTAARFRILRVWFKPGATEQFVKAYVTSGIIKDALAAGCTTLLLAPDRIPARLSSDGVYVDDAQVQAYADILTQHLLTVKTKYGITFHATGILNEPGDSKPQLRDAQWPVIVKDLRASLDAAGLTHVEIIAPESASADSSADHLIGILKQSDAWNSLAGIATHSYNMAATSKEAQFVRGTGKTYWITEASANGREDPHDGLQAASASARVLNDLNHRVTHWVWFLGYLPYDTKDDATNLIRYKRNPFSYDKLQQYYHLRQLAHTFDVGAVFRHATAVSDKYPNGSFDPEMTYTYGKKPMITAAVAQNPDGSWGIGVTNYTSPTFNDTYNRGSFEKDNTGWSARTFTVQINIPELSGSGRIPLRLYRGNSGVNEVAMGTVMMVNGSVTLKNVGPLDLLTLRGGEKSAMRRSAGRKTSRK